MKKLGQLIREMENPLQQVLNKLGKTKSMDTFGVSYQYLVMCRRCVERTLILSKQERSKKVRKMNDMIKHRTKNKEGKVLSPLEVWDVQQRFSRWDSQLVGFLKDVQKLESDWFSLLSSHGLDIKTDEDIEDIRLYVPKTHLEDEEDDKR